jgi:FAD/FMN-containing dehydrogenase
MDESNGVATIGTGLTLGEIDAGTAPYHIPFGVFPSTGCGLILGGGVGFQCRYNGMSVDNIVSARLILADGSDVTANKDENPDLYWALRGCGSVVGNNSTCLSLQLA